MDNHNIDEDKIDTEVLQAQIDLSMSFAQNLVSSWVKPSPKLPNRSRNLEAELKEYMRRPPRLGVGAPIPETQIFSRETARLKGQLTGKGTKRSREEEEDVRKDKAESSDEEESRAGAIKKKVKSDSFGDGNVKKHRKQQVIPDDTIGNTSAPPSIAGLIPTDIEISETVEVMGMITKADATEAQGPVVSSLIPNGSTEHSVDEPQALPAKTTPTSSNTVDKANYNPPGKHPARDFLPQSLQVVDISLTETPVLPSKNRRSLSSQSAEILKQPVLNLDPPSSDDNLDQEAGPEASSALSPKKKRRRKKKKKHPHLADVTMTPKSNVDVY